MQFIDILPKGYILDQHLQTREVDGSLKLDNSLFPS